MERIRLSAGSGIASRSCRGTLLVQPEGSRVSMFNTVHRPRHPSILKHVYSRSKIIGKLNSIGQKEAISTKISEETAQHATLAVLDWRELCTYISRFAQTSLGKQMCQNHMLPPESELLAMERIAETRAIQMMQERYIADMDFGGIQSSEAHTALKRVQRGGMLNGIELVAVASVISGTTKLRKKILECASQAEAAGELECLRPVVEVFLDSLEDLPTYISSKIAFSIQEGGHVRENASDDIRKAAGRVRTLENRAKAVLKNHGDAIEEHGGRLCVVWLSKNNYPPKGSVTVGSSTVAGTLLIEPPAAVPINNDLVSARNELRIAEEAVLWDLTGYVSEKLAILQQAVEAIAWLDAINARYKFGQWTSGTLITQFVPFPKTGKARGKSKRSNDWVEETQSSKLVLVRQLYHPLLLSRYLLHKRGGGQEQAGVNDGTQKRLPGWRSQSRGSITATSSSASGDKMSSMKPVPIDIMVDLTIKGVVITGPNTGGKTAALKAFGISCLMAKCGIPIPAEFPAILPCFDAVLADIGDEQSLSSSLSTFSGHLKRIESLRKVSTGKSLVLLDELGTGTNAIDGAALGISLMQAFAAGGKGGAGLVLATTHHNALTSLKYDNDTTFENASVEFDEVNLQPTYKLLWSVPGRSCALNIAERLGLDTEVVSKARSLLGTDAIEIDEQLAQLEALRKDENKISDDIRKLQEKAASLRASIRSARLENLKKQSDQETLNAQVVTDAVRVARQKVSQLKSSEARPTLGSNVAAIPVSPKSCSTNGWMPKKGDIIFVPSINANATVTSINSSGIMTLNLGLMTMKATIEQIEPL